METPKKTGKHIIETDYGAGTSVWVMRNNIPTEDTIHGITIEETLENESPRVIVKYCLTHDRKKSFTAGQLAPTKDELLKKL